MLVRLLSCIAVAGTLAAVPAQSMLIGLSQTPATATTVSLQKDTLSCNTQPCPLSLPRASFPYAGGSAYDAAKRAVWHTNGPLLGAFHPWLCAPVYPMIPIAYIIGAGNVATGLALNESTSTLWLIDSTNTLYQTTTSWPPLPNTSCPLAGVVMPAGMIAGGLATADVQNLIFYSASSWVGAPSNVIYVASQATPCSPICSFTLPPPCPFIPPLGPITGLAYDELWQALWVTDGTRVVGIRVVIGPAGCVVTPLRCCDSPPAGPDGYLGLCVEPSHGYSVGVACTAPPCPVCSTMRHELVGDAALGNPSFALRLDNAPANATAILCVNIGTCERGTAIPPFCANLLVAVPGILTVGFVTGGGGGCTGSAILPLPVPLNPALSVFPFASQFVVMCSGVPTGTGVSNCQSWSVSST